MDFLSLRSLWSILIIYIIIVIILCSGQNRLNIPILYYYFHLFDHFYLTCEIWLINVASHFWVLHEVNYYFFDVYTQLCLRCNFYWSIVDLQCFVSFRYTTKWFSYAYTINLFFFKFLSQWSCYRILSRISYYFLPQLYCYWHITYRSLRYTTWWLDTCIY